MATGRTRVKAGHRDNRATASHGVSGTTVIARKDRGISEAALSGGAENHHHLISLAAIYGKWTIYVYFEWRGQSRHTCREHQLPGVHHLKQLCAALADEYWPEIQVGGRDHHFSGQVSHYHVIRNRESVCAHRPGGGQRDGIGARPGVAMGQADRGSIRGNAVSKVPEPVSNRAGGTIREANH